MSLRLATPDSLRSEADRIVAWLAERGVVVELVPSEADAELRLDGAEGVDRLPPADRAVLLPVPEPRDVLVTPEGRSTTLSALAEGSKVALAGSLRKEMLGVHRPDLRAVAMDDPGSAADALREGRVHAWIAPVPEVRAVGLTSQAAELLEPISWATAVGRSALVLGTDRASPELRDRVAALDDEAVRAALSAELAVLRVLGVEADAPVGVWARPHGPLLRVRALVPAAEGRRLVRAEVSGTLDGAEAAGLRAGEELLARGAAELLPEAAPA